MYQALYRKYRPKDFDSVVGQDSIIKTLKNSIIHNNFSHAYIFFGPRGTGKTTVSKIFARNINCENPIDGIACEKCDSCKVSFSKNCVDIIEIDAASNNGVDEIRDLKNKISLVPSELKYKVYIIDEVHMLSIGAFNALLKTLEEPPEHAIFILATTDPQKVPETIISRCQNFSFKRISSSVIHDRLKYVCLKEKIKIDDDVLTSIASFSDGGLRDALGLLDKLVSYSDDNITMKDFIDINGIISKDELSKFIDSIMNGDINNVLSLIDYFDNSGKNLLQILIQILNFCRDLLVDYYLNQTKINYSLELIQNFTNQLNEKMFDIKRSSNSRIYIEMFLLKFINDNSLNHAYTVENVVQEDHLNNNNNNKSNKNNVVEKNIDLTNDDTEFDFSKEYDDNEDEDFVQIHNTLDLQNDKSTDDFIDFPRILNISEIMNVRVNNTLALAKKNLLNEEINNFSKLNDFTFDQDIGYIVCSLLDAHVRAVSEDNVIISFEYESNVKQNLAIIDKVIEVYQKITGSTKNLAIITDSQWDIVKNEYINNLKNNVKYNIMKEPDVVLEDIKKNDIISSSAVDLFGDIVEID